ncbi:hypothetical protein OsJ_16837 [Oryza sativa Japonica Group]|uniref:Uncharacterized protein n=1 Tax=Oryza sativa subsp. japonica TaxID=39947 RepID=B9FK24_ORYSJ|nr:hypothetical protein OsJ_16837 [Oryza sativa Japonica Group]
MQDHVVVQQRSGDQPAPSCDIAADEIPVNGHKPGRAVTASVYRAKIAGHSRVLTVSWSRDMLSHSFAVSVTGVDGASAECRVDLRPWQFWRRAGSRRVELAGTAPGHAAARAADADMEMTIAIDGEEAVQVKHLQWKFRGNQSVTFSRAKVEIYWDVHDWLFSAGMRPALFIFRPIVLSSASAPAAAMLLDGSPPQKPATGFCLYLYAWKLD